MRYAPLLTEYKSILESRDNGEPLDCFDEYEGKYLNEGQNAANKLVFETFVKGHLSPKDFDAGKVLSEMIGDYRYFKLKRNALSTPGHVLKEGIEKALLEAVGATSYSQFSNITGQIIFSVIQPAYESEDFSITKLIPTITTKFDGEKVPGITTFGDELEIIGEGKPYPLAGVSETYINTPPLKKRGFRTALTKEAVFFDRTGLLMERDSEVGYSYGLNKEIRAIDALIDQGTGAVSAFDGGHRYTWRGTAYATYQTGSPSNLWNNTATSNALVDWNQVQTAWLLLRRMLNPDTGFPINIKGKHLCGGPAITVIAERIKRLVTATTHAGGYSQTSTVQEFDTDNPVPTFFPFDAYTSELFELRLIKWGLPVTNWYYGDVSKQLSNMQNWPMQIIQAPANNPAEFHEDIIAQWRIDAREGFTTREPRAATVNSA